MSLSRRAFLGAVAAGTLLAGCAGDEEEAEPASDADVIAGLLAGERAAVAALAALPAAAAIRDQDRAHAARLRRAAALPASGAGSTETDPLAAPARKQQNVFAYVNALPQLSDPALRTLVLELLAAESAHLAVLRDQAGEDPVPDAFAGFGTGAA